MWSRSGNGFDHSLVRNLPVKRTARNADITSLMLVTSLAISSCQEVTPLIVVNESTENAIVKYSMPRTEVSPGKFAGCRIERHVPRVRDGAEGWKIAEVSELDLDACTIRLELKAGTSVWVYTNGMCDDYEKHLRRNPAIRPPIQSLTITSGEQTVNLIGWQVARAFRLQHGTCVLRYGNPGDNPSTDSAGRSTPMAPSARNYAG